MKNKILGTLLTLIFLFQVPASALGESPEDWQIFFQLWKLVPEQSSGDCHWAAVEGFSVRDEQLNRVPGVNFRFSGQIGDAKKPPSELRRMVPDRDTTRDGKVLVQVRRSGNRTDEIKFELASDYSLVYSSTLNGVPASRCYYRPASKAVGQKVSGAALWFNGTQVSQCAFDAQGKCDFGTYAKILTYDLSSADVPVQTSYGMSPRSRIVLERDSDEVDYETLYRFQYSVISRDFRDGKVERVVATRTTMMVSPYLSFAESDLEIRFEYTPIASSSKVF